ncbi:MAG: hypothetical protein JST92_19500, partial [Deltaproteobacteria bacterium]|nr:hypothetical protein [Deltaproteobacteria bacterium]
SYEDRPAAAVGVKLLVTSLARHWPGVEVDLTFPGASFELQDFCARHHVRLRTEAPERRRGWDVKPFLLLRALNEGADRAVWLDSDLMLAADPRPLLTPLREADLLVGEDVFGQPHRGGDARTRWWKLPVGRVLGETVNTCVLGATQTHRALLTAWDDLLLSGTYAAEQARPWDARNDLVFGDQDVLTALLGSEAFAHVPLTWLRRGRELVHCHEPVGYHLHERLANLLAWRRPTFLHSHGSKLWQPRELRSLHLELSSYTLEATRHTDELPELVQLTRTTRWPATLLRALLGNRPTLTALPYALLVELTRQPLLRTWWRERRAPSAS